MPLDTWQRNDQSSDAHSVSTQELSFNNIGDKTPNMEFTLEFSGSFFSIETACDVYARLAAVAKTQKSLYWDCYYCWSWINHLKTFMYNRVQRYSQFHYRSCLRLFLEQLSPNLFGLSISLTELFRLNQKCQGRFRYMDLELHWLKDVAGHCLLLDTIYVKYMFHIHVCAYGYINRRMM